MLYLVTFKVLTVNGWGSYGFESIWRIFGFLEQMDWDSFYGGNGGEYMEMIEVVLLFMIDLDDVRLISGMIIEVLQIRA